VSKSAEFEINISATINRDGWTPQNDKVKVSSKNWSRIFSKC
jgi:hypothetical protein